MDIPEHERMSYWLGRAARRFREEAGIVRSQVAGAVPADQSTIKRFEDGRGWPTKIGVEEMLNAYVVTCDLDSSREIWTRAMQDWTTEAEGAVVGLERAMAAKSKP